MQNIMYEYINTDYVLCMLIDVIEINKINIFMHMNVSIPILVNLIFIVAFFFAPYMQDKLCQF